MNLEQLKVLKSSYDQLWEQESALKKQIISFLSEMGSVHLQYDPDGEIEGAPTLGELPIINVDDYWSYEVIPFAIVGSKPMGTGENVWIEFQLVAYGEYPEDTKTTTDHGDDKITLDVLMALLEAYRYYWNDFIVVE